MRRSLWERSLRDRLGPRRTVPNQANPADLQGVKVLPSGSSVICRLILFGVFLLAPAAAAQDAPDVVGTWELVDAENVPYDDLLVFARLTFTPDRLDAVYVFLDPDDGSQPVFPRSSDSQPNSSSAMSQNRRKQEDFPSLNLRGLPNHHTKDHSETEKEKTHPCMNEDSCPREI